MNLSETTFLALVATGMFSMDNQGRLWRHKRMMGGSPLGTPAYEKIFAIPKRAETSRAAYRTVMFTVDGKRMKIYAYRIIWMLRNQADIPKGLEINHKDGNKENNHPMNLEVVTRSQNTIHSYRELPRKKREQRGEMSSLCKLTNEKVMEIRDLCKGNLMTQSQIGKLYGIRQATVSSIKTLKSWSHLIEE